tara:strand:+ start:84 stop:668 length:585 start_codon:yes stop_codon:yes gene_type:complete
LSNYYDYAPTVALHKPLALIGFAGVDYREVGYDLGALIGVSVVDLDRWIEHEAGQAIWSLVHNEGEEALRQIEGELLRRVLRIRPAGIVVLGGGALTPSANLQQVLAETTLVYFKMPLPALYWTLRRQAQERGPLTHPLLPQPLETAEQLRPLFEERQAGYVRAHMTIEMERREVKEAVQILQAALPRLGAQAV